MKMIFLFLPLIVALSAQAQTKAPFTSSENFEYQGKEDQKLLDFGKTKSFQGTITRAHEASDLKHLDLYAFPEQNGKSLSTSECHQVTEKIFGVIKTNSLKFTAPEVLPAHTGKICIVQVTDPDKDAKVPHRHLLIGTLHTKTYALVLPLSKDENSFAGLESIKKFWSSLR